MHNTTRAPDRSLSTPPIPRDTTPCYSDDPDERRELTELFDSTDLITHREARRLCEACPFLDGCGRLAVEISQLAESSWSNIPSGTWGGWLWRGGRPLVRR